MCSGDFDAALSCDLKPSSFGVFGDFKFGSVLSFKSPGGFCNEPQKRREDRGGDSPHTNNKALTTQVPPASKETAGRGSPSCYPPPISQVPDLSCQLTPQRFLQQTSRHTPAKPFRSHRHSAWWHFADCHPTEILPFIPSQPEFPCPPSLLVLSLPASTPALLPSARPLLALTLSASLPEQVCPKRARISHLAGKGPAPELLHNDRMIFGFHLWPSGLPTPLP